MRAVIFLALLLFAGCGQGPMGPVGLQGVQGNPGSVGPSGTPGPQGSPGVNGTSPTIVQFCQGTTTYPSTFCEVGFCYNGTIYATYSANDGFSSEIPPGSWSSNGINCSCNFTVGPNCVVSN